MPDEGMESTGSVSFLGLNKKPKKKKPGVPGLLQGQINAAQERPSGTLSSMAENQGALGTAGQGTFQDEELQKKKKRKNLGSYGS